MIASTSDASVSGAPRVAGVDEDGSAMLQSPRLPGPVPRHRLPQRRGSGPLCCRHRLGFELPRQRRLRARPSCGPTNDRRSHSPACSLWWHGSHNGSRSVRCSAPMRRYVLWWTFTASLLPHRMQRRGIPLAHSRAVVRRQCLERRYSAYVLHVSPVSAQTITRTLARPSSVVRYPGLAAVGRRVPALRISATYTLHPGIAKKAAKKRPGFRRPRCPIHAPSSDCWYKLVQTFASALLQRTINLPSRPGRHPTIPISPNPLTSAGRGSMIRL